AVLRTAAKRCMAFESLYSWVAGSAAIASLLPCRRQRKKAKRRFSPHSLFLYNAIGITKYFYKERVMCPCFNRRNIFWLLSGLLIVFGIGFAGCSRPPDPWKEAKAGQKHVLVTFPPLYSLTHAIAGDDAYVLCFLSTQ